MASVAALTKAFAMKYPHHPNEIFTHCSSPAFPAIKRQEDLFDKFNSCTSLLAWAIYAHNKALALHLLANGFSADGTALAVALETE